MSDDVTAWPLLMRLLHSMDKQASIQQPVEMPLVTAVLATSILADTIAANRAELANMITSKSIKLSKTTAMRVKQYAAGSQLGKQRLSAAVMQNCAVRWEMHSQRNQRNVEQDAERGVLMTIIIEAALETCRTSSPNGLLTKADLTGAKQLLTVFCEAQMPEVGIQTAPLQGNVSDMGHLSPSQLLLQEADQNHWQAKSHLPGQLAPAKSLSTVANQRQQRSWQRNTFLQILWQAEPDWTSLFLLSDER